MATVHITSENFETIVASSSVLILDFWAEWCGPCRTFGPIFEAASEKYPDIVFGKVDTEAEQELAAAFGIQSIPTTAWFREAILLHKQPGLVPADAIDDLVSQILSLDMNEIRKEIAQNEADHDHSQCDHDH